MEGLRDLGANLPVFPGLGEPRRETEPAAMFPRRPWKAALPYVVDRWIDSGSGATNNNQRETARTSLDTVKGPLCEYTAT